MKRFAAITGVCLSLLSFPVAADDTDMLPGICLTQQIASIHVPFNEANSDIAVLRPAVNAEIAQIQSLSNTIGVTRMKAAGVNYSIQPPPEGSNTYQLTGQVNFDGVPFAKAPELLRLLIAKGFPATLSFVEYNQGPGLCRFNASTGQWE